MHLKNAPDLWKKCSVVGKEICVQVKNLFGSLRLYSKTKYQDNDVNETIIKPMVLRNEL